MFPVYTKMLELFKRRLDTHNIITIKFFAAWNVVLFRETKVTTKNL